jgi:D-alanine-D-alanine ligase
MDKVMAKVVLAARGLDVPRGFAVASGDLPGRRDSVLAQAAQIGFPLVVKPVREGSSVGVTMVERPDDLLDAIGAGLEYDDRVLVEERLRGTELTVGVIDGADGLQALPVIEIVTRHDFFDYKAKYDPALTDEICPARIPNDLAAQAQQMGLDAHRALDCRDFSRTDMIATTDGRLAVLEVNTIPGMTANSLLPKAARVAGMPFGELCGRLIEAALARAR